MTFLAVGCFLSSLWYTALLSCVFGWRMGVKYVEIG